MNEKLDVKSAKNRGNKTLYTIALILILAMPALMASLPRANAEGVDTAPYLSFRPNPIGVGQLLLVNFWITPIPPVAGFVWHGYSVEITKPDGTKETKGPYNSYSEGTAYFEYVPASVGTYYLRFSFPGETVSGTYYNPSDTQNQQLIVQAEPIPQWPTISLPTDYWSRPINAENREWAAISGNWLMGGYNASTKTIRSSGGFNPYTTSPNSGHIVWKREITPGGIVGGDFGSTSYYTGLVYESKMTPPVIMNGRLYYNIFSGRSPNNPTGFVCVDLRTGKELWRQNATIFCGQLFNYVSGNQMGVVPYIWSFGPTSTYQLFDAFNGDLLCSFRNSRSGTVYFGPDGTLYVYVLDGTNKWLAMWNSTKAFNTNGLITYQSTIAEAAGVGQLRIKAGTYEWSSGIQWNTTIQNVIGQAIACFNGDVIVTFGGAPAGPSNATHVPQVAGSVHTGYSGKTGQFLWMHNRTFYITGGAQMCAVGEGIYAQFDVTTMKWHGMDLNTGNEVWVSDPHDYPWGSFTTNALIAYGKLFTTAYDGYVHAYDVKTGKQLWKFFSGNSGYETAYGHWPFFWDVVLVAGEKVFAVTGEHSPSEPLYRGQKMFAIDAETGKGIWNISGWFQTNAVADGYLLATNAYDNQLYCYNKGQSATTVTASPKVTVKGSSVLIEGTVTDQSPGQTCLDIPAAGTPAIADDSMASWMEYLYMQKPKPTNATGVPVHLTAIDPNGNSQNIGAVTSDAMGLYKIMWTPPVPGAYTIVATFAGSDSYYGSSAETAFGVSETSAAPSTSPSQTAIPTPTITVAPTATASPSPAPQPEAGPSTDMYIIAAAATVIIAAVAAAAVFLRKRK